MFKNIKVGKIICFWAVLMLILIILVVGNKKIFADGGWEAVNLDLWDFDTSANDAILITRYNGNASKIIIPNANDFNCSKVMIARDAMQSIASKSGVTGIKISETGPADNNKDKVFASGDDWSETFKDRQNLIFLDLDNLDTSCITNMDSMFNGCDELTELNLGDKFNTANVTSMDSMFCQCSKLANLNLGDKFDTSKVEKTDKMFNGCGELTELSLGDKFNTANVTSMDSMFCQCSKLASLDLGDKFDTSKVEKMDKMFNGCDELIELKLGNKFNTSHASITNMFFCENDCPLIIMIGNDDSKLENYDYAADNRILFAMTLKVDGDKIKFKDFKSGIEDFNINGTEKYINVYDTFVTKHDKDEILEKIKARLETEGENLIMADGYGFDSWQPEEDYDNKISSLLKGVYTAQLKLKERIIFYANDGQGAEVQQFLTANTETKLYKNNFTREGYEFLGWNTKSDGTGINYNDEASIILEPGKTLMLYAQWNLIENHNSSDSGKETNTDTDQKKSESKNYYSWNSISNADFSNSLDKIYLLNSAQKNKLDDKDKATKTLRNISLPEYSRTRKYLVGDQNKSINPQNNLTRAEFATVIYRLINNGESINYNNLLVFSDVSPSDWFSTSISYLLDKNIIKTTDKKFRPNENISRGEVTEILFNVFKFYDSDNNNNNNNNYAYVYGNANYNFSDENKFGRFGEAIKQLASNGIINGYENNKFEPDKNITRSELAKIIFIAFGRKYNPGKKFYYDLKENHWAYKFLIDALE